MAEPATRRGRDTRERILLSAVRLFQERGVSATSVDEILEGAGAGKGQFYRYFDTKEDLVGAVVDRQIDRYLGWQREVLERLEGWEQLEAYLSELVSAHEERALIGGCPVGSLALELAGSDELLRARLAEAIAGWQASLAAGLEGLSERGRLAPDVVPARAAASLLATLQGAYLLSTVHRESAVMNDAIQEALARLRPRPPAAGEAARDGTD